MNQPKKLQKMTFIAWNKGYNIHENHNKQNIKN